LNNSEYFGGGLFVTPSVAVRNENSEPTAAGALNDPATQFREFATECAELARTTHSPEKRNVYLEMARVWHQMALRWEKKITEDRPSRGHQSFDGKSQPPCLSCACSFRRRETASHKLRDNGGRPANQIPNFAFKRQNVLQESVDALVHRTHPLWPPGGFACAVCNYPSGLQLAQLLRLGDVRGDPPRLVAHER
jgi:hypothetical protein